MIGFPFDSHVTYDTDGTPVYDRAISSEPLRNLLHKLFTDGILPDVSTNLQVVAGSGMNVVVKAGFAIVQGCLKLEENDRTLAIQASSATNDRIDTVVLRLNSNDDQRYCDLYVREGTPATNPVRPNLVRSDSVYELGLADIFVTKTITSITQSKITDTRYEAERCGVISSLSEYDTTTIYKQVQADLKEFKDTEQAQFMAWYENIKNILDENTAGHLQNEIDATNAVVATKQDKIIKTTITLDSNWTKNETLNYYIKKIAISGITKDTVAIVDVANEGRNSWWIEVWTNDWSKVIGAETYDGGIKFMASEPFERDDVMVQVVAIN